MTNEQKNKNGGESAQRTADTVQTDKDKLSVKQIPLNLLLIPQTDEDGSRKCLVVGVIEGQVRILDQRSPEKEFEAMTGHCFLVTAGTDDEDDIEFGLTVEVTRFDNSQELRRHFELLEFRQQISELDARLEKEMVGPVTQSELGQ